MDKLIVILGPTASGKSDLAVTLARRFSGEIISADSRQVYKGLNVGSGKIMRAKMRGIHHHLLDVANPKKRFTVAQYQKLTRTAIKKIEKHGKIPFLVGGTGFYIQSIVDGIIIPEVGPNWKLRTKLEAKTTTQLFAMLKKLDPARAKLIDSKNPRRLVRAIEINLGTGLPVPKLTLRSLGEGGSILQLGIKKSPVELKKLIHARLQKRIKGIVAEVKKLHNPPVGRGLSWRRLEELGLEYRFVAQYLQNKLERAEMIGRLQKESEHYAKRQMTWFKRDPKIHWVKTQKEADKIIKDFL
ncbi:MAG: tRNA (adenosine(37)-N6)-dimethylallyltransferase MiaA [Candidatus Staskawiczbacteria bacterium]|nr:tRNA (adenosine(37)-N6)-dimethylallyltransferase MiaA [Candidatus Staskawiczbacteria bacterium]